MIAFGDAPNCTQDRPNGSRLRRDMPSLLEGVGQWPADERFDVAQLLYALIFTA